MYIEAECPKVESWYLCIEHPNHRLRSQDDCVHDLITNQSLGDHCNLTTVDLKREAMEQLDDRNYVISFPQPTKVMLSCEGEDYDQLQGSFLVTIPVNCLLRTKDLTIINSNDRVLGIPLKLKKITYINILQAPAPLRLQVNSVNLKSLYDIQQKVILQAPIERDDVSTYSLYHTTIPFYTLLIGALILTTAVILVHRRLRK